MCYFCIVLSSENILVGIICPLLCAGFWFEAEYLLVLRTVLVDISCRRSCNEKLGLDDTSINRQSKEPTPKCIFRYQWIPMNCVL
jgi:hypothetical protein